MIDGGFDWKGKKVLIAHFRVGKNDGVSLEIANWKSGIEAKGGEVKLLGGFVSEGADFVIKGLEYELDEESRWLDVKSQEEQLDSVAEEEFKERFEDHRKLIENGLRRVFKANSFDLVIVSNIFSLGRNLAAAQALLNCLDAGKVATVAVNHDFYWEKCRYRPPSCLFVSTIIREYLLPKRPYIQHATINSLTKQELEKRRRLKAGLIYDCIDFDQKAWQPKDTVKKLIKDRGITKNDIILVQATRILPRKNIETAIELTGLLNKPAYLKQLSRSVLYNGRKFNPKKGRVVLVLAGSADKSQEGYLASLIDFAKSSGIKVVAIGSQLKCLFDFYPIADAVTYPSFAEGFGNQFLEAVFAKKPIIMFEYPVYISDIKDKGFRMISLGKNIYGRKESNLKRVPKDRLVKAANQLTAVLTDTSKYESMTKNNFRLAAKYFSLEAAIAGFEKLSGEKVGAGLPKQEMLKVGS